MMLEAEIFLEWLCWLAQSAVKFTIARPPSEDDQNFSFYKHNYQILSLTYHVMIIALVIVNNITFTIVRLLRKSNVLLLLSLH